MDSSTLRFIVNRFLQLASLAIAVFIFYQLNGPIYDYKCKTELFGLRELSEKEVLDELDSYGEHNSGLNGKSFLEINPLQIKKHLVKNPLIKDVKIRRSLLPSPGLKAYIKEQDVWAYYNDKFIDNNGKLIVDLGAEPDSEMKLDWKVKKHFINMKPNLVNITSYFLLKPDKVELLKDLSKIIENAVGDQIVIVKGDDEENFSFFTSTHEFKLGLLENKPKKRAERIKIVAEKFKKLKEALAYVDLSLTKDEVILGKKT